MHLISNTLKKQIAQPPSPPTQVLVNLRWCGCACSLARAAGGAGVDAVRALCTEWLFARNDVYLFIYSDVCGPGQRLECQSTLTGLLTGLLTGPGADRPELLAAVCGSGLALSRAWGQRGSVTNSSFSSNDQLFVLEQ